MADNADPRARARAVLHCPQYKVDIQFQKQNSKILEPFKDAEGRADFPMADNADPRAQARAAG